MAQMVSIPCESCGEPIFPSVANCPHCGAPNSPDRKAQTKRWATVVGVLLGLGLITLLCTPQTKTVVCTAIQGGGKGPEGEPSIDADPSGAPIDRFRIDASAKEIVFPGSGEIKVERVPYSVNGNMMTFSDQFGGRFELNLKSGRLRSFVKSDPASSLRPSGTAQCTGL